MHEQDWQRFWRNGDILSATARSYFIGSRLRQVPHFLRDLVPSYFPSHSLNPPPPSSFSHFPASTRIASCSISNYNYQGIPVTLNIYVAANLRFSSLFLRDKKQCRQNYSRNGALKKKSMVTSTIPKSTWFFTQWNYLVEITRSTAVFTRTLVIFTIVW